MTAETERKAIEDLWPAHLPHLPPVTNKMGQPFTDADNGIVCNCGDVLGWPEDAPAREPVVEHHYDAAMDSSAMAGEDNPGATLAEPPDDPADEAQAARYVDVHLPPVTDEQIGQAGDALGKGDREGFHRALDTAIGDVVDVVEEVLGPVQPLSDREYTLPESPPVGSGNLPARRSDVVVAEDPISARITIIDPSLPYGPADVEHQLLDIAARIERGVHFQRYWEERAHNAKIDWELENARAIIAATGGDVATRRAQALLDCEDEYRELQVCDTMVKAIRETMHNLRSLQSGYQTVARSVGASMQNFPQRGA